MRVYDLPVDEAADKFSIVASHNDVIASEDFVVVPSLVVDQGCGFFAPCLVSALLCAGVVAKLADLQRKREISFLGDTQIRLYFCAKFSSIAKRQHLYSRGD